MKKFPCKIQIHKRSLRNREVNGEAIFNDNSLTLTDGLNNFINIIKGTSNYHLDFGFRRITLEVDDNEFKCTLTPQQLKNGVSQFDEIIKMMKNEFQKYDIKSKSNDEIKINVKTESNIKSNDTKELMKQLDQVSLKSAEKQLGNKEKKNKKRNKRDWDHVEQKINSKDDHKKQKSNELDSKKTNEIFPLRTSRNNNNDDLYISYDETDEDSFDINSFIILKDFIPFIQNPSLFNSITKIGMKNLGNTCYMNSTLQALLCFKTFISDMIHPILLSNVNINLEGTYYTLLNLIKEKFSSSLRDKGNISDDKVQNNNNNNIIHPSSIKDAVFNQSNLFGDLDQQDAHEFFSTLLHCLEEDNMQYLNQLRRYQKKIYGDSNVYFEDRMTLFCPSKRNFGGVIEKELTCKECKYTSKSFEFFRCLSLEVIETNNQLEIASMLEKYFESEEVEMKCDNCNHQINAALVKRIVQLPRILPIHLKRFIIDSSKHNNIDYKKVYCPVIYGHHIDIKQFCSKGKEIRSFIKYRNTFDEEFSKYLLLLTEIKKRSRQQTKKSHQPLYYDDIDTKENEEELCHYESNTDEWEFEDQSDKDEWNDYVESYKEKKRNDSKQSSKFKLNNQFENDEIAPVDENDEQRPPNSYGYQLKSVIHHIGETATRGHYVTDVFCEKQNKWFHYNDSNVNEIDSKTALGEVNQKTVYMLFYVHDSLV